MITPRQRRQPPKMKTVIMQRPGLDLTKMRKSRQRLNCSKTKQTRWTSESLSVKVHRSGKDSI